ncbi:glutamate receptor 2.5 [Artemisia annua]|uniref:Glutamate receptor 2.5 n=1 Tax=Artemisia annua TaxID=35608 RepID=A0A2U1QK58_ARTAN|nr:glutamate receptor 2.5 [Artemisia annua]
MGHVHALDLLNTFNINAIIGPEVFIGSKLVASIADKAKVPVFSFAASRLFVNAKILGMMSKEYAWILTQKTIEIMHSTEFEVIESLQGVLGVRTYIPASSRLHNLKKRWHKEFSMEIPMLAIWAYDMIWALAESAERVGVPEKGSMLLSEILKIEFKGVSGEFQLNQRKLVSNGFEIINMIDYGERKVGYWTLSNGIRRAHTPFKDTVLHSSNRVEDVIWPEGSTTIPRGWILRMSLGVPFKYFVDAYTDAEKNVTIATGFSVDELDGVLGDTTILANRSEYVDFTSTYTDVGLGTLTRIKEKDWRVFLKPLDVSVWLNFVLFGILTIFTIWAIDAMNPEAERVYTLTSLLTGEQFELATKGGIVGFHGGSFFGGVIINNVKLTDNMHKPYYSYEDYANALSKGEKHGGADAIVDEVPYIQMFLGRHSDDYAMLLSQPITSGFGFNSKLVAMLYGPIFSYQSSKVLLIILTLLYNTALDGNFIHNIIPFHSITPQVQLDFDFFPKTERSLQKRYNNNFKQKGETNLEPAKNLDSDDEYGVFEDDWKNEQIRKVAALLARNFQKCLKENYQQQSSYYFIKETNLSIKEGLKNITRVSMLHPQPN